MASDDTITLYHAPHSRSSGVLALLEELGAPYELNIIDLKTGQQRQPAYLAINPLGKVPAITHRGAVVTEQVAIYIYLADLFPAAGLAPPIGDAARGPYLRWLAYYAACYEPGLVDKAQKREPGLLAMSPYGDFDVMLGTVIAQLSAGPHILGERLSAADLLWGSALNWGTRFGLVPPNPVVADYAARITARPGFVKAAAIDAELVAAQQKATA